VIWLVFPRINLPQKGDEDSYASFSPAESPAGAILTMLPVFLIEKKFTFMLGLAFQFTDRSETHRSFEAEPRNRSIH